MQRVFVGLSGGVDSAVSAYLVKKQGYEVVGAFIKGWEPDFLPCTGAEDRLSAMRVAAHLEVPFVEYDLEAEYKRDVVDYFVSEYKAGRTPNPDVVCNRTIKFGAFWERAKADGADLIATGHYAVNKQETENYKLKTSADRDKDQTYFLWTLTQDDLSHTLFPVGHLTKPTVRRIAHEAGLPNAERKDSQGLCFLGHVDMKEFLKRYISLKRGSILYGTDGKKIGEHEGAWFYTLGEHAHVGGHAERLYIVAKDVKENTLVVSETPLPENASKTFCVDHENWISGTAPEGGMCARYRYRQPLLPIDFSTYGKSTTFEEPQLIAPGQSVVFYDATGDECLGGAAVV